MSASKRKPGSDLNHENWDQEDEAEDAGHFKQAPSELLKERKIIKPKRRLGSVESVSSNPFSSFKSFGAAVVGSSTGNSPSNLFSAFNFTPPTTTTPSIIKSNDNLASSKSSGEINTTGTDEPESSSTTPPQPISSTSSPDKGGGSGSCRNLISSSSSLPPPVEPEKFSFATGLPYKSPTEEVSKTPPQNSTLHSSPQKTKNSKVDEKTEESSSDGNFLEYSNSGGEISGSEPDSSTCEKNEKFSVNEKQNDDFEPDSTENGSLSESSCTTKSESNTNSNL